MRFALAIVAALAATVPAQVVGLTTLNDAEATRSTVEGPFPSPTTGSTGDDIGLGVGSTPLMSQVTLSSRPVSGAFTTATPFPTFSYPGPPKAVTTITQTTGGVMTPGSAAAGSSHNANKSAGGYFVATVVLAVLCALQAIVIGVLAYRTRRLTKRRDRLARFLPAAPEPQPQQNYVPHSAKAYTYEAPRLSADSPPPTASTFQSISPVVRKVSRKAPPLYLEKPEGEY